MVHKKHDKTEEPLQNKPMAEHADAVAPFPGGRGTDSMYREAKRAGITIYDKDTSMSQILKDAMIIKTHRLTADITGSAGKQAIIINLDGEYADSLHEWFGAWYHKVSNTGRPIEGQEKIGSTPEEALVWWVRSQGFVFS